MYDALCMPIKLDHRSTGFGTRTGFEIVCFGAHAGDIGFHNFV